MSMVQWSAVAAVLLTACSSIVPDVSTPPSLPLRARMAVVTGRYFAASGTSAAERDRPYTLELTNVSGRPLWVSVFQELDIEIVGPHGPVPLDHLGCGSRSVYYDVLEPGQTFTREGNLCCFAPFGEPGIYSLRARFHDPWASKFPLAMPDLLKEDVIAEPLLFTVLPASARTPADWPPTGIRR